MPTSQKIRRVDQRPLKEAISTRGRSIIPWLTKDDLIKYLFGANAWMSIVVLGLIMLSLYSESIGFNPSAGFFGQNYRNLLVYRQAGLEFVDILKKESSEIGVLGKELADARLQELKRRLVKGKEVGETPAQTIAKANAALAAFDAYADKLSSLSDPVDAIISPLSDTVTATRDAVLELDSKKAEKQLYLDSGGRTWRTRSSIRRWTWRRRRHRCGMHCRRSRR